MADHQVVFEPHVQAMDDVDELAQVLFEAVNPGSFKQLSRLERIYWRSLATSAIQAGWRKRASIVGHGVEFDDDGNAIIAP